MFVWQEEEREQAGGSQEVMGELDKAEHRYMNAHTRLYTTDL